MPRTRTAGAERPARGVAVAMCAASAVLLSGCGSDPDAPRAGTSLQELSGDVSGEVDVDAMRVGEQLSMAAPVGRVLAPGAFEVAAEQVDGDRPFLVVHHEGPLSSGQRVQLVGTVRVFDVEDLSAEHQLGDAAQYDAHRGQLVLVAEEVDTDVPEDGT